MIVGKLNDFKLAYISDTYGSEIVYDRKFVRVANCDIVLQINGANGDIIEELRARAAEAADVIAGEFVKVARARAQNSPRRA